MKRVAVIGSPGAGKTHFSIKLAAKTGLPLIHLDRLFHEPHGKFNRNKKERAEKVEKAVRTPSWIIDGNYKATFSSRLPAADTIIFLDFPRRVTWPRVVKRRIQYRNKLREEMPEGWKEKMPPGFIALVLAFHITERPAVFKNLRRYQRGRKIIILKNPKEAKEFLKML